MKKFAVVYRETVDGERTCVVVFQEETEEAARLAAGIYFADWNFIEPNITVTEIPAILERPLYIDIGD